MTCPAQYAKPQTRLSAMVTAVLARIAPRKQSSGAAQTPPALPLLKPDGGPQMRLPETRRGNRWATVRKLDENSHKRRDVIETNRRELMAVLSKGVCSNE